MCKQFQNILYLGKLGIAFFHRWEFRVSVEPLAQGSFFLSGNSFGHALSNIDNIDKMEEIFKAK